MKLSGRKPQKSTIKNENEKHQKIFTTELPDEDAVKNTSKTKKISNGKTLKNKRSKQQESSLIISLPEATYTPSDELQKSFDFGQLYEDNLLVHIHKYLEIDTHHQLLYVGDHRAQFAPKLEKYFCLTNPVITCQPDYSVKTSPIDEDSTDLVSLPQILPSQKLLDEMVDKKPNKKLDRILIHDCARNVQNLQTTCHNMMKILHKFGKILIIHRPGELNTLPICSQGKQQNSENDLPFINIIKSLEATGADVQWDLIHIPFRIPKQQWFTMIENNYPHQPHELNREEVYEGMIELSQGPFRYFQELEMEAEDRLMMITASHRSFDCSYPSVQRCKGASQVPYPERGDINFYLPIDEEVEEELNKIK